MRAMPRFDLLRALGMLAASLLFLAGAPAALAQPAPGTASPEETCRECHREQVEGYAASKHSTRTDARAPASNGGCLTCHGEGVIEHAAKRGATGAGGLVRFNDPKVPAETKAAVCLTCHQGGKRIHWDRSSHAASDVACSTCHKVHAAHDKARDRLTQTEVCFTCHKEQRAQLRRPSRHPIAEGKVACSDCHNPHGTAGPKLLVRDNVNDTCYTCHMEKRGPFVRSHEPVQEDCSICHNPHGTTTPALLKMRPPFLCQSCHQPSTHHATVPLGGAVGGANPSMGQAVIMARGCVNCHTQIHGSNNAAETGSGRGFRR